MKKFFALLLSIMLLSTAALAEVKIGQVEYAAHGTSCFAVLTVAMDGDTIVAAHIDEFQFMDAATAEGVPNSDASFGQNYPEGKVLASKVVNDGLYSTNMTTKAGATTPLGVSYNAIEAFVTGKTIAVQTGTTAETYCLDNGYEILSFASNIDAQAALTSGKADAWVVDNEVAVKMAGEQNLAVLDEAMTSEPYALAFAKGSDLVDQVNQALSQLLQDGTVEQIFQEYDTVYVSPLS